MNMWLEEKVLEMAKAGRKAVRVNGNACLFQILATARLLQTDIAVYWQYQTGGGWVRYRFGEESKGRTGVFLVQCIQGGRGHYGAFHCEPLCDYPEA